MTTAQTPDGATITLTLHTPDTAALDAAVNGLVSDKVASKIAAQDPTLWGTDAEHEATIRLSWVSLAESSRPLVPRIEALRAELASEGITRVVLAGMGGSSLAPEVIAATSHADLVALDTTDAEQVRSALVDLPHTVLVVSSKSGGTVETDSHRRIFEKAFRDAGLDPRKHIVVVTDPDSPFTKIAADAGYRAVFEADPNVGGRYSALTAFGLVPTGLAGVDLTALLDQAAAAEASLTIDDVSNPALRLGALLGLAHNSGSEKVILADNGSGIIGFGDWAEQLIAESTGKLGKGLLPVVVESTNAPGFADAGTDAISVILGDDIPGRVSASGYGAAIGGTLGAQMLVWEYAIVVAGRLIGINPFDQPDVESAKEATRGLLDAPARNTTLAAGVTEAVFDGVTASGSRSIIDGGESLTDVLSRFFASAPQMGYIAVQAYLDRLVDNASRVRALIASRTELQTTFGWGPRFLHSTGQYHKGGHPNGVFLQITGAVTDDLDVPDRPYTLAQLQAAQAAGDAQVLRDHGRPVLTLHLTDRAAGLDAIAAALV
ncbi:MAG: glucose-6-phosphate isomerase [Nakamurella sp.]